MDGARHGIATASQCMQEERVTSASQPSVTTRPLLAVEFSRCTTPVHGAPCARGSKTTSPLTTARRHRPSLTCVPLPPTPSCLPPASHTLSCPSLLRFHPDSKGVLISRTVTRYAIQVACTFKLTLLLAACDPGGMRLAVVKCGVLMWYACCAERGVYRMSGARVWSRSVPERGQRARGRPAAAGVARPHPLRWHRANPGWLRPRVR